MHADVISLDDEYFKTIGPAPRDSVKMKKAQYNAICQYMMSILEADGEMPFNTFLDRVHSRFVGELGDNTGWFLYHVKLDMETRGVIEHVRTRSRGNATSMVRQLTENQAPPKKAAKLSGKAAGHPQNKESIKIKKSSVNSSIKSKFISLFKTKPLLIHSPGRINLIGEHTDYNSGYVMPAAINKGVLIALAPSGYDHSLIYSIKYDQFFSLDINHPEKSESSTWVNYLLGVIYRLNERGVAIRNFNCVVDGDLPTGAGLSSSAALECGFVFGMNELFKLQLSKLEMIQIAQWAEHNFVGVQCGIMDQFTSMMGKEDHVMVLDCQDLSYNYFPLRLGEYTLLLCDTNVKHSLASSEYNTRRKECEQGVAVVKTQFPDVKSLRDVTMEMLLKIRRKLTPTVFNRCKYVIEENMRVLEASRDLQLGKLIDFGEKMFATHKGLSKLYEVSCPELDFLVSKAKSFEGVLGARMMGGGFGGCTINIIQDSLAASFIKSVSKSYRTEFGIELSCYSVKTGNGTSVLGKITAPQYV